MSCNSDNIIDITDNNKKLEVFNHLLETATLPVFVFFHMPWCGYCKKMMPVFLQYREKCSRTNIPKAILIIVNGETSPTIFKQFKITSYPQIMVFKGNEKIDQVSGFDKTALIKSFRDIAHF
jgi:thioredoxin 1